MTLSRKLALLGLCVALGGTAHAAGSDAGHRKEALALLQAGGDDDFFDSAHESATEVQSELAKRLGDATTAKVKKRLDQDAAPATFLAGYLEAYANHLDDEKRQANLDFFKTPLFKKIRTAEDKSESAEGRKKMVDFMKALDPASVSEKRQEAITGLANDAGALELASTMLDMALDLQLRAANALVPADEVLGETEIRRQVEQAHEARAHQLQVLVVGDLLFTYRDLTDEEIAKYAAFCTGDAGQWYAQILFEGLDVGAHKAVKTLSPGAVPKPLKNGKEERL